jgi:hypothetical protein
LTQPIPGPLNPYEPPRSGESPPTPYYATETTRLTVAEIRRIFPPAIALRVLAAKMFGTNIVAPVGCAYDINQFFELDEVPQEAGVALEEMRVALETIGFRACFGHTSPFVSDSSGCAVNLLHEGGLMWATLAWTRSGATTAACTVIASRTRDDRIISTTNARRQLNHPPHVSPEYLPGHSPEMLAGRHQSRLNLLAGEYVIQDVETLRRTIVWMGDRMVDYHRARGVFRPMTQDEVERLLPQRPKHHRK